jgi:hypothetical protein
MTMRAEMLALLSDACRQFMAARGPSPESGRACVEALAATLAAAYAASHGLGPGQIDPLADYVLKAMGAWKGRN